MEWVSHRITKWSPALMTQAENYRGCGETRFKRVAFNRVDGLWTMMILIDWRESDHGSLTVDQNVG